MYPQLVYKDKGSYQRKGGTFDILQVVNEADKKAALSNGYYEHVDFIGRVVEAPISDAPPTREEMEIKAKELGLKFDGRTSDAKLLKMIEAGHGLD